VHSTHTNNFVNSIYPFFLFIFKPIHTSAVLSTNSKTIDTALKITAFYKPAVIVAVVTGAVVDVVTEVITVEVEVVAKKVV